jgi:hypothetical protein
MRRILALATLTVSLAVAASANAGAKYLVFSSVDTSAHHTEGTFADARADSSDKTDITVQISAGDSGQTALFEMTDPTGQRMYCWATNAGVVQALSNANNDSRLSIDWDPTTNRCTNVSVMNDSGYSPKQP